jgi:HD-GYP domain-containing protein (c-di-GMP phosphodiesterase class II)
MHSHGRDLLRAPNTPKPLGADDSAIDPPNVLRAFAIYTGVALILAALIVIYFVRHNVEANSMQKVADHAEFVGSTVIPGIVPEEAWDKPLTGSELQRVDDATSKALLHDGGKRVKLYNREGVVIYSTDPSLIGDKTDEPHEIAEALEGEGEVGITQINKEGGSGENTKAIEAYAPVTYPGEKEASGVFELYNDYATAAGSIRQQALPLAGAILLILLLLYVALLPLLRRTTRQLSFTNDELRRRAEDLNENLVKRAEIEQRLRESITDLERSETALAHSQEETIMRLSMAVETRDQETGSHIERMGRYCALLASKIGWNEDRCELLRIASPLHDVGKIAIPDAVLQKPGALTPDERVEMEKHALIGHQILAGSESPLLDMAAGIALTHHEHWDGGGYPNGLVGTDIPVEGRMAAIADVFDALTSDRVYRPAMTVERSLAIMSEGRGSHFDPELLDVFFDSIVEVLLIRDGHREEETNRPDERTQHRRRKRRNLRASTISAAADEDEDARRSMVG